MLLSMTLAGQEHTLYRAAIASIGIPRRKRWHHGIYDVLAELEREDLDPNTSSRALRELGVLLEPLQLLIQQNSYLIESPLLSKPLLEHIAFIQRLATDTTNAQLDPLQREPDRNLRERCAHLRDLLAGDAGGMRNVQEILANEYLHYLPYTTARILGEFAQGFGSDARSPSIEEFRIEPGRGKEWERWVNQSSRGESLRRRSRTLKNRTWLSSPCTTFGASSATCSPTCAMPPRPRLPALPG